MKNNTSYKKMGVLAIGCIVLGISLFACTVDKSGGVNNPLDDSDKLCIVYEVVTDDVSNSETKMNSTVVSVGELLTSRGYKEARVFREDNSSIRIEVPDLDKPDVITDIIGKPVEIKVVLDETGEVVLNGDNIQKAEAIYDSNEGYAVSLSLDSAGTEAFAEVTSENVGKTLSIVAVTDGVERTISSPTINSAVANGKVIINGMASFDSANDLATQVAANKLKVKLQLKTYYKKSSINQALIVGGLQ